MEFSELCLYTVRSTIRFCLPSTKILVIYSLKIQPYTQQTKEATLHSANKTAYVFTLSGICLALLRRLQSNKLCSNSLM